ncbi:MAG: hypothetical protein H6622_01110 [Halobacteriovoraceae bacterium]|nr:hypothetical protein [Halobacteriovoraceae bacterium]
MNVKLYENQTKRTFRKENGYTKSSRQTESLEERRKLLKAISTMSSEKILSRNNFTYREIFVFYMNSFLKELNISKRNHSETMGILIEYFSGAIVSFNHGYQKSLNKFVKQHGVKGFKGNLDGVLNLNYKQLTESFNVLSGGAKQSQVKDFYNYFSSIRNTDSTERGLSDFLLFYDEYTIQLNEIKKQMIQNTDDIPAYFIATFILYIALTFFVPNPLGWSFAVNAFMLGICIYDLVKYKNTGKFEEYSILKDLPAIRTLYILVFFLDLLYSGVGVLKGISTMSSKLSNLTKFSKVSEETTLALKGHIESLGKVEDLIRKKKIIGERDLLKIYRQTVLEFIPGLKNAKVLEHVANLSEDVLKTGVELHKSIEKDNYGSALAAKSGKLVFRGLGVATKVKYIDDFHWGIFENSFRGLDKKLKLDKANVFEVKEEGLPFDNRFNKFHTIPQNKFQLGI